MDDPFVVVRDVLGGLGKVSFCGSGKLHPILLLCHCHGAAITGFEILHKRTVFKHNKLGTMAQQRVIETER
jgi:hypothetical protein